jgi:NADH-quinone oxidoreductase subunit M
MPLLSLAIWLPILAGALLLAFGRDDRAGAVRWAALVASIVSFAVTIPLLTGFDNGTAALQFVERHHWIDRFNVFYQLGVDGLSVWFVLLTAFITVIVVVAAWKVINERVNQYMGAFLILSGLLVGVFAASDGLLFYVFFEATLIPMYLIIGIWGGPRRVYAAFKFFLYTLAGSLLMLVALIYLYYKSGGSFEIATWHRLPLSMEAQVLLFFAFFFAFAVKVPMWPVHTWLPDAHVEAPTGGSVVLAAIMLKLGGYGFLRFSLPIAPDASHKWAWLMVALSLVAVVYIGLVALVQSDMKKLVAYSSIDLGRHRPDGLARFRLGCHVPVHRRALRPRPFARDIGLRRRRQHDADLRRFRSAVRDGQRRPARHGRIRRRMDGDPRHRQGELLDRRDRRLDHDLGRRLHAVDGQARVLRPDRQRARPRVAGSRQA